MKKIKSKKIIRETRRKKRVRAKFTGVKARPRLSVHRTNKFFYAQAIDDEKGNTLASARGVDVGKVGEEMVKLLKVKKIKTVVFDRGSYKYHGKVKEFADIVRKGGLVF